MPSHTVSSSGLSFLRGFCRLTIAVLLALLVGRPAHAQVSATLRGLVTDASGTPVPGTSVTVRNVETGATRAAASDEAGRYLVAALPVGEYEVHAAKNGFQEAIRSGIRLVVNQDATVDLTLQVSAVKSEIRVTGDSPIVTTSTSDISGLVGEHQIKDLPLNGRSFQTLIMLTPGVVITQTAFDDQGQFSVNGQRADANYFTVDGVSANFGVTGYFPLVQAAGGALPEATGDQIRARIGMMRRWASSGR